MQAIGLRVPPWFVITTSACAAYFDYGERLPLGLEAELQEGVRRLEVWSDRSIADLARPLLLSVRSGAAVSMPGMMDTVTNLGMNAEVEGALAEETGNPTFAAEVHRRFSAGFGRLVLGSTKELDGIKSVADIHRVLQKDTRSTVPSDVWSQLHQAIGAVFASSRSRRATAYRRYHNIVDDLGTSVTVQAMVFGNLDDRSGTGVIFSRDPATGRREPYGEFIHRGQGEDLVSGRITPQPLEYLARKQPEVYEDLLTAASLLEADGRDAQDVEFTVQSGTLFLLQARPAKRTARAAVRIAVDLVHEGTITPTEALNRVTAEQVRSLLRPTVETATIERADILATGTSACPGAATGIAVANPEQAQGRPDTILVRPFTSPDDIEDMTAARAVVTEQGGATSHAAVVCRALDIPCVVGCGTGATMTLIGRPITVDATNGNIYDGAIATRRLTETDDNDLHLLTQWAQERAPLIVVGTDDTELFEEPVFDADKTAALATADEEPPPIPPGARTVKGAIFSSIKGLTAALKANVRVVSTPHRLPTLLNAIAADNARSDNRM